MNESLTKTKNVFLDELASSIKEQSYKIENN